MSLAYDLFNLLLPELCVACSGALISKERVLCLKCLYEMPRTRFESFQDNPVARLFWGRIPIENASSYFRYQKGSRFQSLIHDLKYRGRRDIGRELGRLMGTDLAGSPFSDCDMILPVPLHPRKNLMRGYNQCDPICKGLSERLGIPFYREMLERPVRSSTQTNKSRIGRWSNVEGIFRIKNPLVLSGKHILLVDDVVTTGSTLEACAREILDVDGTRVSIATLAVALKTF